MGDDLKYRIVTEGDIAGAKKVEEALANVLEQARKLDSKKLSGFAENAAEFASLTAAVELAKKAIENYADAEEQVFSLDAALAARAQLTDTYRVALQKLAAAQQDLTGVKSEEWLKVFTTLTQAGGDSGNIKTLTEATKNLASVLGGDLQSAAFAVGKALNGEFTAFTRLGIIIDESAPQAKKLEQLWSQLAERGGGQLEGRNETLKGSFRELGNATGDLLKGIGSLFVTILPVKDVVIGLGAAVNWVAGIFSSTIPKAEGLRNAVTQSGAAMQSQEEIVKRYAKSYEALKSAAGAAATELERALAAIRAKADQDKSVAAAKADAQLKRIDIDEKAGRISPTEAARLKSNVNRDLENENYKRDQESRDKQIKAFSNTSEMFRSRVDQANREASEEKKKLEEMQALQHERAHVAFQGRSTVDTMKFLRDRGQASNKDVDEAESRSRMALIGFDLEHGKIDLTTQAEKAKQAKDAANKANADLYPQETAARAKVIELQNEQAAEARKHGWVAEANRLDAYAALEAGRQKERGTVQRNPDGSFSVTGGTRSGQAEAVSIERQSQALSAATPNYPIGSRGDNALLAQRDRQIKQYQDIIDGISKLSNIPPYQEARMKALLARIEVLESQNRNRLNRE